MNADDFAWYGCLATQHHLGHAGFKALVAACGSAREVYSVSQAGLKEMHPALRPQMLGSLAAGPDFKAWDGLREACARGRIRMGIPKHAGYPSALEELESPPPLLFLRGEWRAEDARAAALVGTRDPTPYGREAAWTLARDLAAADFTVVSGLALGIDAAAHEGALAWSQGERRGRTLAVIGCGLDYPYPRENLELRERIEESGAVISEHPPGAPPQQMNFPRRNRLISALARATVVVEAGEKSGALLTAAHALRQNKPLFAVPGPIFSPMSLGTHALLRRGATLLASADDLVAVLEGRPARVRIPARIPVRSDLQRPPPRAARGKSMRPAHPSLFEAREEDPLLKLWEGEAVCGVDALVARAVARDLWPAERASSALLEALLQLELKGQVERVPGPAYRRIRK